MQGIYAITNKVTGREYIGSSVDIENRLRGHFADLRRGKHHCVHLQRAWDKYGEKSFGVMILCIVPQRENLLSTEQYYLDNTFIKYNINLSATAPNPWKGKHLSTEHKAKIAQSHVGITHTPESKLKIGLASKGRPCKEDSKKKISAALTGKSKPPRTPEHRAKLAAARRGKPVPSLQGRPLSEEHRHKLRLKKLGVKQTPEHIANRFRWRLGSKG